MSWAIKRQYAILRRDLIQQAGRKILQLTAIAVQENDVLPRTCLEVMRPRAVHGDKLTCRRITRLRLLYKRQCCQPAAPKEDNQDGNQQDKAAQPTG